MASPVSTSATTYWPAWTSAALVAAGVVVIVVDTTNPFVVLGVALLGLGIFGFARRRRPSGSAGRG
jgi:LPXTG-motif cell wall-anchored protein